MTNRELRKLKRVDLLEILVEQSREIDRLRAELETAQTELAKREIAVEKVGSIAEAALAINEVFEAAQKAADQYLYNVEVIAGVSEEVAEVTEEVAEATEEAAEAIEEATEAIEEVAEVTEETAEVPEEVTEVTEEVAEVTEEVAEVTEEVAEVTEEVAEVTEEVAEVTEEVAEVTEEVAETTEDKPKAPEAKATPEQRMAARLERMAKNGKAKPTVPEHKREAPTKHPVTSSAAKLTKPISAAGRIAAAKSRRSVVKLVKSVTGDKREKKRRN